jgi:tRNA(Arg) A34 adenosine deaminase TadA
MRIAEVSLWLPDWVEAFLPAPATPYPTDEDRMTLVVELARQNVRRGTGGPFAAAVFDTQHHTLVAPGVNVVISQGCSIAHAEILALAVAQRRLGSHDLGAPGAPPCELTTSAAPCAMCLGAIPWSGVRRVVCGAREADVRAVGFDEGDKPAHWPRALERRGIAVVEDIRREEATAVLREYVRGGGLVYNERPGKIPA